MLPKMSFIDQPVSYRDYPKGWSGLVAQAKALLRKTVEKEVVFIKRYCKNVSIYDEAIITAAVYQCLDYKRGRGDVKKLMEQYATEEAVVRAVKTELIEKHLRFTPIWYKDKIDESSGKVRHIGIQDVKHQIFDKIAVLCLEEMTPYVGEHQYARKGKTPEHGIRIISRWMRNKEIKYVAKLDIKKCYESITKNQMMMFLQKHIKNDDLLWLIGTLIDSYGGKLSIGSHLSQQLCDLFLAQIYHQVSENMFTARRGKRVNWVKHIVMYRDDILLLGTSSKNMHKAIKAICAVCDDLGLSIKPTWKVYKIPFDIKGKDKLFADIMGYRAYRHHVTIRKTTFKKVRRAYLRANRRKKSMPIKLARKIISYYGKLKHSDSFKFQKRVKVKESFKIAKKVVSNYDKSNVRCKSGRSKALS